MADTNKVKFGLKNVHYAVLTETSGVITYGTPVAIKGAVNLTLDPSGDETNFFADDTKYYAVTNDAGYTGSVEFAKIPDQFKKDVLGFVEDTNNILFEDAEVEPKSLAAPAVLAPREARPYLYDKKDNVYFIGFCDN